MKTSRFRVLLFGNLKGWILPKGFSTQSDRIVGENYFCHVCLRSGIAMLRRAKQPVSILLIQFDFKKEVARGPGGPGGGANPGPLDFIYFLIFTTLPLSYSGSPQLDL
jgi:hypothetical protein